MKAEQQNKQWSQIVAKAAADAAFKKRLLDEPLAVLKEHGVAVPSGVTVKVVEDTDHVVYLTLPARPVEAEQLDEAALEKVAGGVMQYETLPPADAPSGTTVPASTAGGTTVEYKKKTTYD